MKTFSMDSTAICFIQLAPPQPYNMPISEFTIRMTLEFINNSAKISGDALYGGNLDQYSTTLPCSVNNSQDHQHYSHFIEFFKETFNIKQQHELSSISSDPRRICFCNKSLCNKFCNTTKESIKAYPGRKFNVSVITVGQMRGSTQGRRNAFLVNEKYPSHRLFRVGRPISTDKCVNLTCFEVKQRLCTSYLCS